MFEQFKKLNPPIFTRKGDPSIAESWIRQMKKFFTYLNTFEGLKVTFEVFHLVHFADSWWRGVSTNEKEPDTWSRFLALFVQEHYPSSWREWKHQEFLDLMKGNVPVTKYRT